MDPEREFGLIFSVLPLKSNNFISLCLILLFLELLHWISPSVKKKKVIGMNILVSNPFWFLFTCWHFFQGLLQLFGRKLLNISYESTGDKLSWLCLYFSPFKHILQNFILAAPFLSSVLLRSSIIVFWCLLLGIYITHTSVVSFSDMMCSPPPSPATPVDFL